jgi:NAD(P)-dependent dehydrogenase (short-subunit alcohol dehydrogenase family)
MKRQHSGKIITVSSVAGTGPSIDGGYAHFGAAKAAIAHYTRYLAQVSDHWHHGQLHRARRDRHRTNHGEVASVKTPTWPDAVGSGCSPEFAKPVPPLAHSIGEPKVGIHPARS